VNSWYATWRRSPQAAVFEDTDWLRLAMLAPDHAAAASIAPAIARTASTTTGAAIIRRRAAAAHFPSTHHQPHAT
jgi:hypothetical protein